MGMGVETANVVLVVIIVIVFFMLMSACCRQLRNAYEDQLTLEELNRRRQAFIFGDGEEALPEEETRRVRVTAIASGTDRVFGVYEIRVPRRTRMGGLFSRAVAPPPPFHVALQNSTPVFYIDPEEAPPSYDAALKLSLKTQSESETSTSTSEDVQKQVQTQEQPVGVGGVTENAQSQSQSGDDSKY